MTILKNKHLVAAMIIAPVLAVMAYFATDYVISEKPQVAKSGEAYPLSARSNCRYESGRCTLKNGDVEVNIQAERRGEQEVELTLTSQLELQSVLLAVVENNANDSPVSMKLDSRKPDIWKSTVTLVDPAQGVMRLVLNIAGVAYYTETTMLFVDYTTSFSRENFHHK